MAERAVTTAGDGSSKWPASVAWLREHEFPLSASWAYMNHAACGPIPVSHVRAAHELLTSSSITRPPLSLDDYATKGDEVRGLAAALFRCAPADIALLTSTTEALGLVPLGLELRSGDEVILYEREYPNLVYPWLRLRKEGVRIRWVPDRGGRFELDDLAGLVTSRTRVVSLSLVNFVTGFRAPVEEIGRLCREREIWLVVDAIQAAGAIPVSAAELDADVLAAGGYKHLLSGYAIALCYCSERARGELDVPTPGWVGTERFTRNDDVLDYEATSFTPDARRFERSIPSVSGLFGAAESLRLLVEADPRRIERHVLGLLDGLVDELRDRAYVVHSSLDPRERSTLLSVSPPGPLDRVALEESIRERRVSIAIREGAIRVSPHLYNTRADIERLLEALP